MKQDIFTQVGKRTPYRTPEGFFAGQEHALKQAVCHQPIVNRKSLNRKWIYAVAACAVVLIAVYPVIKLVNSSADSFAPAPVYSSTSSASDEWSDFADADIFMDNMNW